MFSLPATSGQRRMPERVDAVQFVSRNATRRIRHRSTDSAGVTMAIIALRIELVIEQAQSLKDRRQVVRSLKDKLRHGFNISVAELDEAVTWQSATIGVAAISNSRDYLSGLMRQVENAAVRIANELGAQVADSWCTFLEEDAED